MNENKFFIIPYYDGDIRRVIHVEDMKEIIDGIMDDYPKTKEIIISVHNTMYYAALKKLSDYYKPVTVTLTRSINNIVYAMNDGYVICIDSDPNYINSKNLINIRKYIN